jgi:hypothetical protein
LGKKGPSAYELDLLKGWKGYWVFNEGQLKRYCHSQFVEQLQTPSRPDLEFTEDGGEEYKVREVLAKRISGGKVEYLIHWEGYGLEDDT